jgi:hypothetical protein
MFTVRPSGEKRQDPEIPPAEAKNVEIARDVYFPRMLIPPLSTQFFPRSNECVPCLDDATEKVHQQIFFCVGSFQKKYLPLSIEMKAPRACVHRQQQSAENRNVCKQCNGNYEHHFGGVPLPKRPVHPSPDARPKTYFFLYMHV